MLTVAASEASLIMPGGGGMLVGLPVPALVGLIIAMAPGVFIWFVSAAHASRRRGARA